MIFRGSHCPSLWEYIADTLANICNTLTHNPSWDPSILYDDLSSKVETPLSFTNHIPFHQAKSQIPPNNISKVESTLMVLLVSL
jgi:hypothetical protein